MQFIAGFMELKKVQTVRENLSPFKQALWADDYGLVVASDRNRASADGQ